MNKNKEKNCFKLINKEVHGTKISEKRKEKEFTQTQTFKILFRFMIEYLPL
jgi:hypothetical protein